MNRYARVFASGMDPAPEVSRPTGHGVVAGHFALRHGVRRHSVRTRRADRAGGRQLPYSAPVISALRGPDPALLGIPAGGSADSGTNPAASVAAGQCRWSGIAARCLCSQLRAQRDALVIATTGADQHAELQSIGVAPPTPPAWKRFRHDDNEFRFRRCGALEHAHVAGGCAAGHFDRIDNDPGAAPAAFAFLRRIITVVIGLFLLGRVQLLPGQSGRLGRRSRMLLAFPTAPSVVRPFGAAQHSGRCRRRRCRRKHQEFRLGRCRFRFRFLTLSERDGGRERKNFNIFPPLPSSWDELYLQFFWIVLNEFVWKQIGLLAESQRFRRDLVKKKITSRVPFSDTLLPKHCIKLAMLFLEIISSPRERFRCAGTPPSSPRP